MLYAVPVTGHINLLLQQVLKPDKCSLNLYTNYDIHSGSENTSHEVHVDWMSLKATVLCANFIVTQNKLPKL